MIAAGKFNARVRFVRLTPVRDALGGSTVTETDLGFRWCRIEVPRANDAALAQQHAEIRTHVLVTRDRPAPCNPGDIAEFHGTRYVVLTRRPDPENGVVYLDCRSDKP